MICNKNDCAPELQQDDNQPPSSSNNNDIDAVAEGIDEVKNIGTIEDNNEQHGGSGEMTSMGKQNNVDNIIPRTSVAWPYWTIHLLVLVVVSRVIVMI